ncbi:MAG TPA: hypothetical protein VFP36_13130 [Usitatibacter sp.]|nr:hypothetical protein [Usitatibacter sp.]
MKRFASFVMLALLALMSPVAFAQTQPSYQGLWWNAPGGSESGWGLNIAHQGSVLFVTWFTYDADGKGMWLVVPDAQLQPQNNGMDGYGYGYGMGNPNMFEYMGTVYRTTGPAFNAATFNASAVNVTAVGDADFMFTSPDEGMFSYTVNGVAGSKAITRQVFSSMPTCSFGGAPGSFQDLWWKSPAGSESGWGVNITQQGAIMFVTWFTYGADGKGMWLVASDVRESAPGMWMGTLFSTSGPAFSVPAWDSTKVKATPVGTVMLMFDDMNSGTFTATVNGSTIDKAITRQVFAAPASACR